MARPTLPSEEKRTVKFTLQLTTAQKQQLIELAQSCGIAPATLARNKIFSGRFPQPRAARIDLYTYHELKKIGVNLNQLTRKANVGIITTELLTTLFRLERRIDTLIAKLVYDSQSKDR